MKTLIQPPYLPPEYENRSKRWVGSNDPYAPQYEITKGPSLLQIELSQFRNGENPPEFFIESRTADMDDDHPSDELGWKEITIKEIIIPRPNVICFFGWSALHSPNPTYQGDYDDVWVWDYDDSGTGALDFRV